MLSIASSLVGACTQGPRCYTRLWHVRVCQGADCPVPAPEVVQPGCGHLALLCAGAALPFMPALQCPDQHSIFYNQEECRCKKLARKQGVCALVGRQVRLLQRKFAEVLGEQGRQLVDINTIDGFQVPNQAAVQHAWTPARAP